MIYILYSNDYEVYLGGNYLPEEVVLIDTTNLLLEMCSSVNIPLTLFSDVACLWRYRELGYTDFPAMVDRQLKNTIVQGHDVQAHLHPHWQETAISRCGKTSLYTFDRKNFLLGNFYKNDIESFKLFATNLLLDTKTYLTNLLASISDDYECVAFRAGGSGLQPYSELIIAALLKAGFRIDSSIVPKMLLSSNVNRIDYNDVPEKSNYWLSPEGGLKQFSKSGIFEIPIIAMNGFRTPLAISFFRRIEKSVINLICRRRNGNPPRGYSVQDADDIYTSKPRLCRIILNEMRYIYRGWHMLELSADENLMFSLTKKYLSRFMNKQQDIYFALSMHSKSITPRMLRALGRYHEKLLKYYGSDLKAITYQYAARQIEKQVSTY